MSYLLSTTGRASQRGLLALLLMVGLLGAVLGGQSTAAQDASDPFITTWRTTAEDSDDPRVVTIPTSGQGVGDYDFTIDWGDGVTEDYAGSDPDPSHTYSSAGEYTIEITGTFPHFDRREGLIENSPPHATLLSIDQWGSIQWQTMETAFEGAEEMTYNASDTPNLSNVTNMNAMFEDASSFNGTIGDWDVSNVKKMEDMFRQATSFNQSLNQWDVSGVTNMAGMFRDAAAFNGAIDKWDVSSVSTMANMFEGANAFNQPIGSWQVGSVTDMGGMFFLARSFNQDISGWNVSSVTDMGGMFTTAENFDQPIGKWDVSSVTDMAGMFSGASDFNQDLSSWNDKVSNVTDMASMFRDATAFNQDISGWDVSSVQNMRGMFEGAESFNQPIGQWDVSAVLDMSLMFRNATAFNQDLSGWDDDVSNVGNMFDMFFGATAFNGDVTGWDVSNVSNMSGMFEGANAFNRDIGDWDVSNVRKMRNMFNGASAFNQDLGDWDVTGIGSGFVTGREMEGFLVGTNLSPTNYDELLIGWSQLDLADGITFDVGASYTPAASEERQSIIDDDNWTINDQGALSPASSATKTISGDGTVSFGETGATIAFSGTGGSSGDVTVDRFGVSPSNDADIEAMNVSQYRFTISAGSNLSFNSAEIHLAVSALGGITDPTKVTIYTRSTPGSGSFSSLTTDVEDQGTSDISDDTLTASTSSFSEFVLASDSNPLPVELAGFDATVDDGTVRLSWRTVSETGNARFEVQRAHGAAGWSSIGRVEGAGTTTDAQSYRFADADLPYEADRLTYRLKQVDTDGSASFSETVTIERTVTELQLLGTYPNPARSQATVQFAVPEQQDVTLQLYDVLGRQVRTVQPGEIQGRQELRVDVSGLASGTYFLRLMADGQTRTQKLTIAR